MRVSLKTIFTYLLLGFYTWLTAQIDSLNLPVGLEEEIETYIENLGEEVDFDYNTIYEQFNSYLRHPLNLNNADNYQLEELGLLSHIQINSLLDYRKKYGKLIAIYELQAIPNFDLAVIHRILPYVTIKRGLDELNESFGNILKKSSKKLFIRWSRNIETQQGFRPKGDAPPSYLGDPNKLYLRYIHAYENRISFGFTMEKDAGEQLFKGSNKTSFDFVSAHFFYKNINKVINRIVIGDFKARFGQGLILNTGFAPGKSSLIANIKRSGSVVNRFTSVNEQNYFRGVGTTLNITDHWRMSGFVSYRKRDGNLLTVDTSDVDLEIQNFTSLQLSGLHRTEKEIESKNSVKHFSTGVNLQYKNIKGKIAFNLLYNKFTSPIGSTTRPYNQFYFRGTNLLNASIDYHYNFRNLHFFGETAWSDNHQLATVNGLIANIHPKVALALHSRFLPRNFHSLFGQTFAETNGNKNENGLYLGLEFRPTREWRFTAYADTWKHPWLRFRADAPSKGFEYFARITFYQRKKMEAYIHWKYEQKQESYKLNNSKLDELLYRQKTNVRFQLNKKITKRLELRSRIEFSIFDIEKSSQPDGLIFYDGRFRSQKEVLSTGFVAFQDVIYKPTRWPIALTTRFAIFDVSNYDARIYAFENEVTYQFSIPAYYNKGTRFYANLKYRAKRHLTLEARFAQTYWANQTEFGSGNNRIDGQTRSEVKVQMRWRF